MPQIEQLTALRSQSSSKRRKARLYLKSIAPAQFAHRKISQRHHDHRQQLKVDSQSLIQLRNLARVSFQIYIRQRDKDLPCISCNKSDAKWDAGHYLKAEIYTKLIFNEDNVHKQCSYCNLQLAGNLIEYRKGLVKRIGVKRVEDLEDMADSSRTYKFAKDELINLAKQYKLKIKNNEK